MVAVMDCVLSLKRSISAVVESAASIAISETLDQAKQTLPSVSVDPINTPKSNSRYYNKGNKIYCSHGRRIDKRPHDEEHIKPNEQPDRETIQALHTSFES
jgi:hypothetical protein